MAYADPARVQAALQTYGLDGLMAVSPENFEYFSGVSGFPVTMWRRAGLATALVSARGERAFVVPEIIAAAVTRANPGARIYSYQLWIESVDVVDAGCVTDPVTARIAQATAGRVQRRPEVYDSGEVDALLCQALHELSMHAGRIGMELDFAPASDVVRLAGVAGVDAFRNSSQLIRELKLIKTSAEIELLRRAVALTEAGISGAVIGIDEQTRASDIRARYLETCSATARVRGELGYRGASTGVHLGPWLWADTDPTRPAQRGDVVQFDSLVQLNGYKTDMGRTFTFGPATDDQRRIQDALLAGFAAGLEQMRPGKRFSDIFHAVQQAVRGAGFPSYTRGHVGHSIGSDIDGEEWPWISPEQARLLEPGMVLAFEVPYYINGIGGFQNEDNLLITETGYERFNCLPLELTEIG